jgi:hypothetical protein
MLVFMVVQGLWISRYLPSGEGEDQASSGETP